jgi:hypothetical protein
MTQAERLATLVAWTSLAAGCAQSVVPPGPGLADLGRQAQAYLDTLSPTAKPTIVERRARFPSGTTEPVFALGLVRLVRDLGRADLRAHPLLDVETTVRLGSDPVLIRLVVGRDGGRGDRARPGGQPGTSARGVQENRPGTILIVAAGRGGDSRHRCAPPGGGGAAGASSTGAGGALFAFAGHGGNVGLDPCDDDDPRDGRGPADIGDPGPAGGPGGDADARGIDCQTAIVEAYGGNGGNGTLAAAGIPGGTGGAGGAGGYASAACGGRPRINGDCLAVAIGGSGGNGASGAPRSGHGGRGGPGGDARADACCLGAVLAYGGPGGNGGNGSPLLGRGNDGGKGGAVEAIQVSTFGPGALDALGGIGGNGGNGFLAGRGARGGAAGATYRCEDPAARTVRGGPDGRDGQPSP